MPDLFRKSNPKLCSFGNLGKGNGFLKVECSGTADLKVLRIDNLSIFAFKKQDRYGNRTVID